MRLAILSTMEAVAWGGSEVLWARTALEMRRRSHEVCCNVKYWQEEASEIRELESAGISVHRRREPGRSKAALNRIMRSRIMRRVTRVQPDAFRGWLRQIRPDILVISQGTCTDGLGYGRTAADVGVKFVMVGQAAAEQWWPPDSTAKFMREQAAKALKYCFVSEANLRMTESQLAMNLANGIVVRNPFAVRYDAAPPWPEGIDPLRLACVGRLDAASKGQDLIIDVLSRPKWKQRNVIMDFYGSGPNREMLELEVERRGIKSVHFKGFEASVERIWASHHALVLASRYEGLSLAVVEAMLCGRPCVVTDVAGNAELLVDGEGGFVAAAATAAALDIAMERLWEARHRLREMGRAASVEVRRHVSERPELDFADLIEDAAGIAPLKRPSTPAELVS